MQVVGHGQAMHSRVKLNNVMVECRTMSVIRYPEGLLSRFVVIRLRYLSNKSGTQSFTSDFSRTRELTGSI
jgi:hypothetical protein